jgi:hypothetical protein
MTVDDFIGKVFGKLTVLKKEECVIVSGRARLAYLCKCECGSKRIFTKDRLTKNDRPSRSCGCSQSHSDPATAKLASAKFIYRSGYSDGDLSFDKFLKLSQKECHYCGIESSNSINIFKCKKEGVSDFAILHGTFKYNGLDRKDNSLPHNEKNVVPCCRTCNWAKGKMSLREFKVWIRKVHSYIEKVKK